MSFEKSSETILFLKIYLLLRPSSKTTGGLSFHFKPDESFLLFVQCSLRYIFIHVSIYYLRPSHVSIYFFIFIQCSWRLIHLFQSTGRERLSIKSDDTAPAHELSCQSQHRGWDCCLTNVVGHTIWSFVFVFCIHVIHLRFLIFYFSDPKNRNQK